MRKTIVSAEGCANLLAMQSDVVARRRRTGAKLQTVARALGGPLVGVHEPSDPVIFAMLNQLYVQARYAAARNDRQAAARALLPWYEYTTWFDRWPLSLAVEHCTPLQVHGLAEPAYGIGGHLTHDIALDAAVRAALVQVEAVGFRPLLEIATGIIVALGPVAPGLSPVSFSLSFLPGTTHAQFPVTAAGLGEILVHEAVHSWLNECLALTETAMPSEPMIQSPWKGALRPPLAILHSAAAFATVVCYMFACERRGNPYELGRATAERQVIVDHRGDIDRVIDMVPSQRLRELVRRQVDLAIGD